MLLILAARNFYTLKKLYRVNDLPGHDAKIAGLWCDPLTHIAGNPLSWQPVGKGR